jgi:hypothetical protein
MSIFNIKESLEETINKLIDLVNANLDYYKIVAFDKLILILMKSVSGIIALITVFMIFFFGSLALAFFLGEILSHLFWGFVIVSALYGLIGAIVWINRVKWIVNPIISALAEVIEETSEELDLDNDEFSEH